MSRAAPWLLLATPLAAVGAAAIMGKKMMAGRKAEARKPVEEAEGRVKFVEANMKKVEAVHERVDRLVDEIALTQARYKVWWGYVTYDFEQLNRGWIGARDVVLAAVGGHRNIPADGGHAVFENAKQQCVCFLETAERFFLNRHRINLGGGISGSSPGSASPT